jgi:hypothetical protein
MPGKGHKLQMLDMKCTGKNSEQRRKEIGLYKWAITSPEFMAFFHNMFYTLP